MIPCGAKLPIIALVAGAVFGGAWWVAPLAYFLGLLAVIVSGIILKKTKMFQGDPSPFVMELPAYHVPSVGNVARSTWERSWSFIKRAGTVILLSSVVLWFLLHFAVIDGSLVMIEDEMIADSIAAKVGAVLGHLFAPLGFGGWQLSLIHIYIIAKKVVTYWESDYYWKNKCEKSKSETFIPVLDKLIKIKFQTYNKHDVE